MSDTHILIASHNIGRGEAIPQLHHVGKVYLQIREALPRSIDVLCLQEQQRSNWHNIADDIATFLAPNKRYKAFFDRGVDTHKNNIVLSLPPVFPDPAIIYDSDRLYASSWMFTDIPKLDRYDLPGRIFSTDKPRQRTVASMEFRLKGGDPFSITSFHLDAWGGNAHKQSQLVAASDAVSHRFNEERRIMCGDTNIYAPLWIPSQKLQRREFNRILKSAGVEDPSKDQTHHYSRLPGDDAFVRIIRTANKLRLLARARFDTVAGNMPVVDYGTIDTPWSDHDLVWAIIDVRP